MIRTSSVARRVISFGERNPLLSPQIEGPWLVSLRWLAASGMLGTTLLAKTLVPSLEARPILIAIGGVIVLNVAWSRILARSSRPFVVEQLTFDMAILGAILWYSGGVTNPFASFLTFQIALAGLLAGGKASVSLTALALALIGLLFFAPPLSLEGAALPAEALRGLAYLTSLVGLGCFLGLSAFLFGQRLGQTRAQKEQNEQLAMLGRIAGGMAHELNTPLSTILVASNELVSLVVDSKSSDVQELARLLASESRRAADLIELLRGQVRPDPQLGSLDIASLLRDFVPRELDRLSFRGERTIDLPDASWGRASVSGLRQIVANLLKNAVEATSLRSLPRIEVRLREGTDQVEVLVADNGHGIPKELVPRLGEPFQTTKELEGGTGLGLYVCSVIAKRMGARLEVESREGRETRVTLSLRGSPLPSPEPPSWPASKPLSSSTTITPSA